MDGELMVESHPDGGSTFHFNALFQEADDVSQVSRPSGSLEGMHALIVDDHEQNLVILADFVARLGMEVDRAISGPDALDVLDRAYRGGHPIDVALLDCQMPEMDGFELAARIREDVRFTELLIVVITAAGRPGDGVRCQELGIASYLLKPLAPWELRDALLLSLAPEAGPAQPRQLVTRHSLREGRTRLRVLLAEDNEVNQQLAMHMLTRFGHTVRLARTGIEALEALESEQFDVVLMDIQMPEMDGTTATAEIRRREAEAADGRHVPIVAMTAHAMVGDRERFLSAGMDDYVSKPISRDRLREVLRSIGRARIENDELEGSAGEPVGGAARGGGSSGRSDGAPAPPEGSSDGSDGLPSDGLPAPEGSSGESEPPPHADAPSYDRAALMERMESDADLIRMLVTVFDTDSDELLSAIEEALSENDAVALERAAHTLKGAVAIFAADRAQERAALLERLGRAGSVAEARGEYGPLRDSVLVLKRDLAVLVGELGG
jgi:CheY-like chemotaxis protein